MSEQDICNKFITPAIKNSGWKEHQFRYEYSFTDGAVIVRGNLVTRGKRKRADYLLSYIDNLPLAIVEAKDNKHNPGDGMQQAIDYANILDVPFAFTSNGDSFIEHDMTTGMEREISIDDFPTPEELWTKYKIYKGLTEEQADVVKEPYYSQMGGYSPRYYQRITVNRIVEAVLKGERRILATLATGTGKTFTAFNFIHKLHKTGVSKRVLYLADRNILIDQTIIGDFKPFNDSGILTKVRNRTLDSSYEIHLALYQQLIGEEGERIFEQFAPDFFDLIVIDEAHRGSANADSQWRQILEYFDSAVHVGMTATPKEPNFDYFTYEAFCYSLKDGIADGFLAPYKVMRVGLNVDLEGYRPTAGTIDVDTGEEVVDREYNNTDYDRHLVIDERTKEVAKRVSDFLKANDRYMKTIVFCVDIDHANRMRQALINENADIVKDNPTYIMKITGDDNLGKAQLDNFIAVNSKFPTIAVTSELMSTGVDAKMCKLIAVDKPINSQTMFKQILGRGTRLRWDDDKKFFTFMDFRDVSRLFADPEFDGDPIPPDEGGEGQPGEVRETPPPYGDPEPGEEGGEGRHKFRINGIDVRILNERVQYVDVHGKLITESIKDFTKKNIKEHFATMEEFIKRWSSEDKKQAIIDELKDDGVLLDALRDEVGYDIDDFDLILHVAFDKKPLTRSERANNVKKRDYLNKYEGIARDVLEKLLEKYSDAELKDFTNTKILNLNPFDEIGTPKKIIKSFGGKKKYDNAVQELEELLYA